ncbi:MAG: CbiX/SirB N-terminal domain-containing protein [Burkholderiaceae bacterium]
MMRADPQGGIEAIVLFCHGARRASWREPFDALRAELAQAAPSLDVRLAFLELMEPGLPSVIDQLAAAGRRRLSIVPVFLAPGSHTREDLPRLVGEARERWPELQIETRDSLTENAAMRAAIIRWILQP